jgi:hypothetical protein
VWPRRPHQRRPIEAESRYAPGESTDAVLPCLACGARLLNVDCTECDNQPLDGVEFTSLGHYGSTVFDPMDGSRLVINVCDACLKARHSRIGWQADAHAPVVRFQAAY